MLRVERAVPWLQVLQLLRLGKLRSLQGVQLGLMDRGLMHRPTLRDQLPPADFIHGPRLYRIRHLVLRLMGSVWAFGEEILCSGARIVLEGHLSSFSLGQYISTILQSWTRCPLQTVASRWDHRTDTLLKLFFLALRYISLKWSIPIHDWKAALTRFTIEFGDRLSDI
jgi:hypothetical protein